MTDIDIEYSISDVSRLTGIKSHTLRIWESRYDLLNPKRTETNVRSYSESDVRRILGIIQLRNNGFNLGQIANFSEREFDEYLKGCELLDCGSIDDTIESLMINLINNDESLVYQKLNNLFIENESERIIEDVILKIHQNLGVLLIMGAITKLQASYIEDMLNYYMLGRIYELGSGNNFYTNDIKIAHCVLGESTNLNYIVSRFLIVENNHHLIHLGEIEDVDEIIEYLMDININYIYINIVDNNDEKKNKLFLNSLHKLSSKGVKIILRFYQQEIDESYEEKYEVLKSFTQESKFFKQLT